MVFTRQGQKTGVKGFTYELGDDSDSGRAGFFQAGVKENANVWVKHYTSPAAFEAADSRFGAVGQVGGMDVRTQSPNSGSSNTGTGDFFAAHQVPDGTTTRSIAFPSQQHGSVTFDGTNFWAVDTTSDTVYEVDSSGNQLSSFNTADSSPAGITWDGQYLWIAENGGNDIAQFTTSGTQVSTFNSPAPFPTGVTWDGSYLWNVDNGNEWVYKLATDGTQVDVFDAPAGQVAGITWDGSYLWITNSGGTDTVYQVDRTGNVVSKFGAAGNVSGVGWNGEYLYTADNSSQNVNEVTGSASLDLSYQVSGFPLSTGTTLTRNLNETVTLGDTYSDNTGRLTGFIYKDGSKVANAYVYAVEKSSGGENFKGAYVTKSSGKYEVPDTSGDFLFEGDTYLVGVDYYSSADTTYYGEEESIVFSTS